MLKYKLDLTDLSHGLRKVKDCNSPANDNLCYESANVKYEARI